MNIPTDGRNTPRDASFRAVGSGHAMTFRCARCEQPKQTQGRRMQSVQGLRQYVCRECAR